MNGGMLFEANYICVCVLTSAVFSCLIENFEYCFNQKGDP